MLKQESKIKFQSYFSLDTYLLKFIADSELYINDTSHQILRTKALTSAILQTLILCHMINRNKYSDSNDVENITMEYLSNLFICPVASIKTSLEKLHNLGLITLRQPKKKIQIKLNYDNIENAINSGRSLVEKVEEIPETNLDEEEVYSYIF